MNELEGLDRELDLFVDSPEGDPVLLEHRLHPPLPVCGDILGWGFGLLKQAFRLGLPTLPCLVSPPVSRGELLELALRLEGRAGGYSWREKANILQFVHRRRESGDRIDLASLSPWIEGRPDPQLERKIERYLALPPAPRRELAAGRLELKSAELATRLPPGVLDLLASGRALSFSERRQFVGLLLEVSRRDHLTATALHALAGRLLTNKQPLRALNALRFPRLSDLQERYAALAESLWKGSGIRIEPPPYFEGDSYAVAFRFSNADNLSRKLRILRRVAERADELFEFLR